MLRNKVSILNVLKYNISHGTPKKQAWHTNIINKIKQAANRQQKIKYSSRQLVPYSELTRNRDLHENLESNTTIVIELNALNINTTETAINNNPILPLVQNINPTIIRAVTQSVNNSRRQNLMETRIISRRREEYIFENIHESNQIIRNDTPEQIVSGEERLIEKMEEISREQKIAYEAGVSLFEGIRFPYPQFNNVTFDRLGIPNFVNENRIQINELYCHFNVVKRWVFSIINRNSHIYSVQRPSVPEQLVLQHIRRVQEQGYSVNMEAIFCNVIDVSIKAEGFLLVMIMLGLLALVKKTYVSQLPVRILDLIKRKQK
jgi:hypothetical protein